MAGQIIGLSNDIYRRRHGAIFGVRHYVNEPSPVLERIEESVGMTFQAQTPTKAGFSDFDDAPIYGDIKLCVMESGIVTAYEGDPGFSRTPADGNVMVEIPRFYYKVEVNTDYTDYLISSIQHDGFIPSPRHAPYTSNPDGHEKVYWGAYQGNNTGSKLLSRSGLIPSDGNNRGTFRTYAKNHGAGYWIYDWCSHWTLLLLYMIETADLNSQIVLGPGSANYAATVPTGYTDTIDYHSGYVENGDNKYRHIENIWGGTGTYYDGLGVSYKQANIMYISDPHQYSDLATYPEENGWFGVAPKNPANGGGYITSLAFFPEKNIAYPINNTLVTGSSATFFCDKHGVYANSASTYTVATHVRSNANNVLYGMYCLSSIEHNTAAHNGVAGGRLMFLP